MCLVSAPTYATPPDPVKPQDVKTVQQGAYGATARKGMSKSGGGGAASTLLTGPSGVENNQLALGRSTLLGQ